MAVRPILLLALLPFLPQVGSANTEINDPYLNGFLEYSKELNRAGADTASSMSEYVKEVQKEVKKIGYIGPELQLPPLTKVMDGVYTVVGSMIWHNPENFGLNNNLTFIEFEDGIFVFNAGPNPAVAFSFHQMIKRHTSKPVKWVAVENSQGHAYLGSSYWVDVGVKNFYSHDVANQDFHRYFDSIKKSWSTQVGENLTFSARDVSDKFTEFDKKMVINVGGGETVELLNFGPGHTPGSTLVYVPSRKLLLTGDVAYNERALALFTYTHSGNWIKTFNKMLAAVPADTVVIPGHGGPSDLNKITVDTRDYLVYLHEEVKKVIAAGGTEADVESIDQSMYKHRPVFEQTHKQNTGHVYRELTGTQRKMSEGEM